MLDGHVGSAVKVLVAVYWLSEMGTQEMQWDKG